MTEDLTRFYDCMVDRLHQIRRQRSEYEEILTYCAKVLAAQRAAQSEVSIPELQLPESQLKLKIEEGFTIFERDNFPVDMESSKQLFRKLCNISLEENPLLASAAENLLAAWDAGKIDFPQVIEAILQDNPEAIEALATNFEVTVPIFLALTKMSIQPSLLAAAAGAGQHAALVEWRHGYCPICGSLPAIAALMDEEGKRKAICSFCAHIWQIPRLGCPYCDSTEQRDLSYFYGEGEEMYRVQVCEQCRSYLKIIDTRDSGDVWALGVDDVATSHLDLLAEEEGYHRKAPRFLGI